MHSRLKHINSFLFDQKIDAAFSNINGKLKLILRDGKLQLQCDDAVYSYEDLYSVFAKGFKQINIHKRKIKNVLILGFGLGSVPIILEKRHQFEAQYLGIEIDDVIIDWNKKYLPPNIYNKCNIIKADAFDHVFGLTDQTFDLIIVDVFIGSITPEKFREEHFLEKLSTHLTNTGTLLYNTLAHNKEYKNNSSTFYKNIFSKVFERSNCHKVLDNNLLEGLRF